MNDLREFLQSQENKKLLAVFAHPDDETMAGGGLILAAKEAGYDVTVVILTQGGAGQLHIHPKGKTTKQVRKIELEKAIKVLGVDKLLLFDFDDGKLRQQTAEWIPLVEEIITKENPGIIETFDPSGWTGHPDHIVTSVEVKKLMNLEGSVKLLWPTIDPDGKKWMNEEVKESMPKPNLELPMNGLRIKIWSAAKAYKSQRFSDKRIMPLIRMMIGWKTEWYHEVDLEKEYTHKFVHFDI
jgi:N-acetylglucosamine malate deacetylase 2